MGIKRKPFGATTTATATATVTATALGAHYSGMYVYNVVKKKRGGGGVAYLKVRSVKPDVRVCVVPVEFKCLMNKFESMRMKEKVLK